MPIIRDQHTSKGAHILVWQDKESLDYFKTKTQLTKNENTLLNKYSALRRKKDLLIARYLLQQVIPQAEIIYCQSGKPYLKNKEAQISISHSNDLVAVMLHPHSKVGIDIEYISPRVERVKQRFLSDTELKTANTTTLLTLYWSAKETLFKLDDKQGLDFRSELALSPNNDKSLSGRIRNGKNILVHYADNDEWVMTYAEI